MRQADPQSAIPNPQSKYTLLGFVAIIMWSTSVAFARTLTEDLGVFTAGAAMYLCAGTLSLLFCALRPGKFRAIFKLPKIFLLVCGGLFSVYTLVYFGALGLASDRQAAIVAGIINYLWPALTLAFSIPILKQRARWTLWPGMLVALIGIVFALWENKGAHLTVWAHLRLNWLPYSCAGIAAITWGLYSNFCKRLAGEAGGAVPLFFFSSGVLLSFVRLFVSEHSHWDAGVAAKMAAAIIFPVVLGYTFWDRGVRRGNLVLLALASYFIPIASTVVYNLSLHVAVGANVWTGCCLVTAGALICKFSFKTETVAS